MISYLIIKPSQLLHAQSHETVTPLTLHLYNAEPDPSPHPGSLLHRRIVIRIQFKQRQVLLDGFALACHLHIVGCEWIAARC